MRGFGQQGAGKANQLALTERKICSTLAHLGRQTLRQALQKIETVEAARGINASASVAQQARPNRMFSRHRASEKKIRLENDAQLPPQRFRAKRC